MRFTFKHLAGSRAGQEQAIEGRVVNVGRNPTNLLSYDAEKDDRVSGNHAQFLVMDDGRVLLSDLGSRNGTFVNQVKITGPTPITPGAVVQFGSDGGPQVSVAFGDAPAPAPAAAVPTPAKGGSGMGICLVCGVLLLVGLCVVGGVFAVFGMRRSAEGDEALQARIEMEMAAEREAEAQQRMAQAQKRAETPPPVEAPPPPPPAVVDRRTAWGKCGVGTSFSSAMKSTTKIEGMPDPYVSEMTMTQTVVSVTDDIVKVKTEMTIPNVPAQPPTEQDMPAKVKEGEAPQGEKITYEAERSESVTVPAGTFTCTYRKWKMTNAGVETTIESWMDEALPVAYKTVTSSASSSSVSELTKLEKR